MALTKISTGGVKDDSVTNPKVASNAAIQLSKLEVIASNKIVGNDSGNAVPKELTPAEVRTILNINDGANNYTHPNHSGEVTSTADGAQVIASDVVDEDNLKISNAGTNGQYLQKQSGNTGGLTWADVTIPPAGNTFTAVAEGAIANNKAVQIRTDGKVEQIAATTQVTTTPNISQNGINQGGTGSSYHDFGAGHYDNMAYDPESDMILLIWKNTNDTALYYKMYEVNDNYPNEINAARTSAPDYITGTDFACCSLSNRRFAVCYEDGSKMKIQIGQVASDGSDMTWGSAYYIDGQSGTAGDYREPHMVAIGDDRIAFFARANSTLCEWGTNKPGILVGDVTSTNVWNFRDGTAIDGTHNCDGQWRDITYDSTNDIIAFVWRRDSTDTNAYIMGGRVSSGTSPTFTFGTPSVNSSGKVKDRVRYNSAKDIFVSAWEDSGDFYMRAHTINSTTLAVTSGTAVYWNHGTGFSGGLDLTISTEGGAFGMAVDSGGAARLVSATFAGTNNLTTTINGTSNRQTSSNYGSLGQGSCVYVADVGKILTVVRSGSGSSSAMILGTNDTTSLVSNFTNNEFFVGYADQAYTNGQTATIKTYGNNVDTLSGLTVGSKYYVQGDGTLGTSADVPVARAGIALAADKLLIQEPTNWGG